MVSKYFSFSIEVRQNTICYLLPSITILMNSSDRCFWFQSGWFMNRSPYGSSRLEWKAPEKIWYNYSAVRTYKNNWKVLDYMTTNWTLFKLYHGCEKGETSCSKAYGTLVEMGSFLIFSAQMEVFCVTWHQQTGYDTQALQNCRYTYEKSHPLEVPFYIGFRPLTNMEWYKMHKQEMELKHRQTKKKEVFEFISWYSKKYLWSVEPYLAISWSSLHGSYVNRLYMFLCKRYVVQKLVNPDDSSSIEFA